MIEAKLFVGGRWLDGAGAFPVKDKYAGRVIARAARADRGHVRAAVAAARRAFKETPLEPYRRYEILARASELVKARSKELADTISAETGFTVADAAGEVGRAQQTLLISAEEAKRVTGEMVPIEAAPGQANRFGFTLRVPLGVVAAITPFNAPLNTVLHKVAPALAAGNTVVLKPASYTPVSAVRVCEILTEAGLPPGHLNLVMGGGGDAGLWLLEEPDVRFYTFTGSTAVGRVIQEKAGLRRTQLELGNISATIVAEDADLEWAVPRCAGAGFRKAGQVCTSVQRLYVQEDIAKAFGERLAAAALKTKTGDPKDPATQVGPMIDLKEAERAEAWIGEAVNGGARALAGNRREGALYHPTVLADANPSMRVMSEEIFAPVISVVPYRTLEEAIERVNATSYGLAAGIFTSDLKTAMTAARRIECGSVHINETSSSRVDLMPYGGVKDSGFGREGPRYAIREMTDERTITVSLP
jgi:succinate-semialdehyde dehydrogenase/glutarate-semialdehyde dehydrogenase